MLAACDVYVGRFATMKSLMRRKQKHWTSISSIFYCSDGCLFFLNTKTKAKIITRERELKWARQINKFRWCWPIWFRPRKFSIHHRPRFDSLIHSLSVVFCHPIDRYINNFDLLLCNAIQCFETSQHSHRNNKQFRSNWNKSKKMYRRMVSSEPEKKIEKILDNNHP